MLAPPVLSTPSDVRLSQASVCLFLDDSAWRTAVTSVELNGVPLISLINYTLTAGKLTILGESFNVVGSYSVIVKATGYDDTVEVTFDVSIANWNQLNLGSVTDCIKYDSLLADSSVIKSETLLYAKDELRAWIESRFADMQDDLDDYSADIELVDNIKDLRNLRQCFRYLVLSLGLSAVVVAGQDDMNSIRAEQHNVSALQYFTRWCNRKPFELGFYRVPYGTIRFVQ